MYNLLISIKAYNLIYEAPYVITKILYYQQYDAKKCKSEQ